MTLNPAGPLIVAGIAAGDKSVPNYHENPVFTTSFCQGIISDYAATVQKVLLTRRQTTPTSGTTAQKK